MKTGILRFVFAYFFIHSLWIINLPISIRWLFERKFLDRRFNVFYHEQINWKRSEKYSFQERIYSILKMSFSVTNSENSLSTLKWSKRFAVYMLIRFLYILLQKCRACKVYLDLHWVTEELCISRKNFN